MKTRQIRVTGCVQGVGFRYALRDEAQRLGVNGWVRNCADGSVEALASGPTKSVENFVSAATKGPHGARVTAVNLTNSTPPTEKGFHRKPNL